MAERKTNERTTNGIDAAWSAFGVPATFRRAMNAQAASYAGEPDAVGAWRLAGTGRAHAMTARLAATLAELAPSIARATPRRGKAYAMPLACRWTGPDALLVLSAMDIRTPSYDSQSALVQAIANGTLRPVLHVRAASRIVAELAAHCRALLVDASTRTRIMDAHKRDTIEGAEQAEQLAADTAAKRMHWTSRSARRAAREARVKRFAIVDDVRRDDAHGWRDERTTSAGLASPDADRPVYAARPATAFSVDPIVMTIGVSAIGDTRRVSWLDASQCIDGATVDRAHAIGRPWIVKHGSRVYSGSEPIVLGHVATSRAIAPAVVDDSPEASPARHQLDHEAGSVAVADGATATAYDTAQPAKHRKLGRPTQEQREAARIATDAKRAARKLALAPAQAEHRRLLAYWRVSVAPLATALARGDVSTASLILSPRPMRQGAQVDTSDRRSERSQSADHPTRATSGGQEPRRSLTSTS